MVCCVLSSGGGFFCMFFFFFQFYFYFSFHFAIQLQVREILEYFHKPNHVTVLCCLWQKCQMFLSRLLKWRSWQKKLTGNLWGERSLSHDVLGGSSSLHAVSCTPYLFFVCDSCLKAHSSKTPLNCGYSIYEGQPSSDAILFPQTVKVIVISPEKSWKDML